MTLTDYIRCGFLTLIFAYNSVNAALVAYWPLNDGTGQSVLDQSGSNYHGVLGDRQEVENSDPVWVDDDIKGTVLEWSGDGGSGQWVNLTDHLDAFRDMNQGTITAWIKLTGGDAVDTIIAASDQGDGSSEWRFFYENGLRYDLRDESANPADESGQIVSSIDVADDQWHFVAVTISANHDAILYVDGREASSGEKEPFFSGVTGLDGMWLGKNIDSSGDQWVFKGRMSHVAIFDKPLSQDIIQAIYAGADELTVEFYAGSPSPNDTAGHVELASDLSWHSGADQARYTLYLGTDPAFPDGPVAVNLSDSSYPPEILSRGTRYYWRVDVTSNNQNYMGNVWTFDTVGKATNPFPADEEKNVYTGALLTWTGDDTITSYDIYLAPNDQSMQFIANVSETIYRPVIPLKEFTDYHWRVDTRDDQNNRIARGDEWTFKTQAAGIFFEENDLFVSGTEGYHTYRIPAIIVAPNGDILAFCEGRKTSSADHGDVDIVMKRSIDNGQSWSSLQLVYEEGDTEKITIGNPCPVVDQMNGRLWMPFCRNNDRVFVGYSDDNGLTWSERREITSMVKPPEWGWYATGPGVGIQLRNEPYHGRLIIPSDHGFNGNGSHMMYSDDHGETWCYGERILPGCNECQAVELIDGRVMNNARTYTIDPDHRGIAVSLDGGHSFSEVWFDQELPEPTCQASFLRYTRSDSEKINRLLFSNPAHISSRINMTVKLSYDEGDTWPVAKQIYAGSGAYSCLTILPDWSIGCLYEKDNYTRITLARFSLQWLTDGEDRVDAADICIKNEQADLNRDCRIDLQDMFIMIDNWLACGLEPMEACNHTIH